MPPNVLEVLAGIPTRLAKQNLFEGGTARALMDALKAIAQSETSTLDTTLAGQVIRVLLNSINIIQIRNSESEMIDLLSAMNRLDRQFLRVVVQEDCSLLAHKGWVRNISAVMKTIQRVENRHSTLFNQVLVADWCTPDVRSIILEVRGA